MAGSAPWQAEAFRLTAFPLTPRPFNTEAWWTATIGSQPEVRLSQPRVGVQVEEAAHGGGKLSLVVDADRLHWGLVAADGGTSTNVEVPSLGPFEETIGDFRALGERWFLDGSYPGSSRLAFGATLSIPVRDRTSGLVVMRSFLHSVNIDTEGMSDFAYQVNRPRKSSTGIPNLEINRLSKWAVVTREQKAIRITAVGVEESGSQPTTACIVEMDINTAPRSELKLASQESVLVFQELLNFAIEISRAGDIPWLAR